MKLFKNTSYVILILIGIILSSYRISNVHEKEISWDVLGYYIPLPSTFIYGEPLLNNYDWLKKINKEKNLTGTLYMISSNDDKEPMYFFLLGMAMLYLPFFLIGHFYAILFGFPSDGFSMPYQYAMVIGAIIFMLTGLYYLRKILRNYFSDGITSVVLLIIVFSTNYIHHLTIKNLETVNVLFMFVCIILWYTIQWHKEQKFKYLLTVGISISLMALVKPSEVVILFLPLLWNVYSIKSLKEKVNLISIHKAQVLKTIGICFLVGLPQMTYWLIKTGLPFYDSYKNPGVGLDFFAPHLLDTLFSFRKGWLLYTPVMLFSLMGFPILYNLNKKIFYAILTYFLITFYIITSWSEWWYGAGFSNRPLISTYPVLAIALGYFMYYVNKQRFILKPFIALLVIAFTFLNQFQWWQQKNYILDPYRTTKDYYLATFLKTEVSPQDKELLLLRRDFSGNMKFTNRENYKSHTAQEYTFENSDDEQVITDSTGNSFYRLKEKQPYALTNKTPYKELTKKDHLWAIVSFDVRFSKDFAGEWPGIVIAMDRKEGNYKYFSRPIEPSGDKTEWQTYTFEYITPEIRNTNDKLLYYFWKKGTSTFDIDNLKLEIFEKK